MTAADFDFGGLSVTPITPDEAERLGVSLEPPEPTPPRVPFDEPDSRVVREPRRKNGSGHYEQQLAAINRAAIKTLAKREETLPDAAILLLQGPDFCKAWGNAAAEHDKIARAIEWLAEPTDNPLLLAIFATAPIVLQMFRNHEPMLQPKPRGFRVPFLKDKDGNRRVIRLPKIGIRLDNIPGYEAATNEPSWLVRHVFGNADVQKELKKQGIDVTEFVRAS